MRQRRPVEYRIEARLDAQTRTVTGALRARWQNRGRTPVDVLTLHLYLNAFANNRTTLMTGLGARAERWWVRHADGWGRIDLAALRVGGRDALADLAFVQPDDGNPDDHTLARLQLPGPVPPRGTVELEIDFISSLAPYSGSAWQAATGLAPGMARLWCLALFAQGLWGAAIAGPLWAFVRATAESPSAWVWYAGGDAAAGVRSHHTIVRTLFPCTAARR